MFKRTAIKKMEKVVNERLSGNMGLVTKYGALVNVSTKTNSISVLERDDNTEVYSPYNILGRYKLKPNELFPKYESIREVRICLNTIYIMAKRLKADPMILLNDCLNSLFYNLELGVKDDRFIPVPVN